MNPSASPQYQIRPSTDADVAQIRDIYRHYVEQSLSTFEEVAPSEAELARRRAAMLDLGLPYLVAHRGDEILGYAYASTYRPRAAYRYTVENSVYVRDGLIRQGIGRALLAALITACEQGPWRQMLAVIGNSANDGSIGVHAALGFEWLGILKSVGFKHGQWVDTVLMQRALGSGDSSEP